jgi:hypothetical protein
MQAKVQVYEIESFGAKQTKKVVFIDQETMDKVDCLVSDSVYADLLAQKGKMGVLCIGLVKKGYDYGVAFKSFKAAA